MYEFILWFYVYSFLGWICETIYCSIPAKNFIKRGMLKGPVCPIYGFGSLFAITLLNKCDYKIYTIFILGLLLASILEFITSFLLEKIFNRKWWDYSKNKFNINGRVCLLNSTLFGILSVCLIKFIHPIVIFILIKISLCIIEKITRSIVIIFVLDAGTTFFNLYQSRKGLIN